MIANQLFPSHIPSNGCVKESTDGVLTRIEVNRFVLPSEHWANHYSMLCEKQLYDKMTYYSMRDNFDIELRNKRVLDFVNLKYSDIVKGTANSDYGKPIIDPRPYNFGIPDQYVRI